MTLKRTHQTTIDGINVDAIGSLWQASTSGVPELSLAKGTKSTDVVIVGAGFTGLSAALELRRMGVAVIVLEAVEPGWGASGRNSGLVIPTLTRPDPAEIITRFGEIGERFVLLLRDCAEGFFRQARELGLGKHAEQTGWLQPAHSAGRMALIENRVAQWAKWNAAVELMDRTQVRAALGSNAWYGGMFNRSGGTVNPLALVYAMVRAALEAGVAVHHRTPAISFHRNGSHWIVITPAATIRADALLLATNAYTSAFSNRLAPTIAHEILPVTSWLAATEPLPESVRHTVIPMRLAVSDTRRDLHFARYDDQNRLISGGILVSPIRRQRRLGALVAERLMRLWPQTKPIKIDFVWNGTIGITPDRFPRFHRLGPDAFVWTGCNGRAVALSVAVGKELAKVIAGVPKHEISLPLTTPGRLLGRSLLSWLTPLAVLNYRWRDTRE